MRNKHRRKGRGYTEPDPGYYFPPYKPPSIGRPAYHTPTRTQLLSRAHPVDLIETGAREDYRKGFFHRRFQFRQRAKFVAPYSSYGPHPYYATRA